MTHFLSLFSLINLRLVITVSSIIEVWKCFIVTIKYFLRFYFQSTFPFFFFCSRLFLCSLSISKSFIRSQKYFSFTFVVSIFSSLFSRH